MDPHIAVYDYSGAGGMYPYTRSLERVPSPVFRGRRGVYEHRHVVAVVLNRSEWSAKRSRSEREADHERRQSSRTVAT